MGADFLLKGMEFLRVEEEELPLFSAQPGQRVVVVKTTVSPTQCPHCGSAALYAHGTRKQIIVDAPHFGQPTVFEIERQRWRCKDCKKTMSDTLHDIDEKHSISNRLVRYVCQNLVEMTFKQVAALTGLSDSTVRKIFVAAAQSFSINDSFVEPSVLGLAEIKVANSAYTVLMNLSKNTLIDLLPDATENTVIQRIQRFSSIQRVEHVVSWPDDRLERAALAICTGAHPSAPRAKLEGLARKALDDALMGAALDAWGQACFDGASTADLGESLSQAAKALQRIPLSAQGLDEVMAIAAELAASGPPEVALKFHQLFYRLWPDVARKHGQSKHYQCIHALGTPPPRSHAEIAQAFETHAAAIRCLASYPQLSEFAAKMDRLAKAIIEQGAGYGFETLRAKLLCSKQALQKGTVREEGHDMSLTTLSRTHRQPAQPHYQTLHYGADLDVLFSELEAGRLL